MAIDLLVDFRREDARRGEAWCFRAGDVFTIEGVYRPQTLWQRLMRRPRQLQVFYIETPVFQVGTTISGIRPTDYCG